MDGRAVLIHALLTAVCSAAIGEFGRDRPHGEALHNEVLLHEGGGVASVPATAPLLGGTAEKEGGGAASGDALSELPRVAFLSKPQGPVTPRKKGNGNKRRKGKGLGKKRDPCLRKYKDFCIHVVLSSLCLVIIAALLMFRCHKRGVYDVENEEKIKLGITVNH
ncbi:hypothetical protein CIB84_003933 [Bambusicola thoracicus]|uniref:Uncharacterized protein n=1 Tax=Bambusicola thoracicus TaxID=9083 RepID=A0A2P4T7G7_BAMTH|nr:hypothetical protein CIB84_003933 [Bambusicola thoracicus]